MSGGQKGVSVTSAALIRNFAPWQDLAVGGSPVTVTHYGRPRVVLLSAEAFEGLCRDGEAPQAHETGQDSVSRRYSAIIENTDQGLLALDARLAVSEINRIALGYLGESRERVIGRRIGDVAAGLAGEVLEDRFTRILRSGQAINFELTCELHPGRTLSINAFPYGDGVAALISNVSEREEMAQRLRVSEGAHQALIHHPQIGFAEVDARGRMTLVNGALATLAGLSPINLFQCRLVDLVRPADRSRVEAGLQDAMDDRSSRTLSVKMLFAGAEERSVNLVISAYGRQGPTGSASVIFL